MKPVNSTPPPYVNRRRGFTGAGSSPLPLFFLALLLVSFLLLGPARGNAQTTLVSNTGQTSSGGLTVGFTGTNHWSRALSFTTGSNSLGYTLSAVDVKLGSGTHAANTRVSIYETSSGSPTSSLHVLNNPSSLTASATNTFTANAGATLDASTTYAVVIEIPSGQDHTTLDRTDSHSEDEGAASGWSIGNNRYTREGGGSWAGATPAKPMIAIKGTLGSPAPPPPPPPPPPVIESPEGVSHSGNPNDGFSLTPLGEGGSIVYRKRTIDIPVTRDECTSPGNPALIISRSTLDRVREITFELSEVSPQDPPSGFRMEGCVAEIDPGIRLGQRETVAVCLPPADVKGEAYVHRYDEEWKILPSRSETVNGEELVCGDTDSFSMFGVFLPVIESAEGVTHSEDKEYGFSLTPLGEGGSIVYGEKTIDLSVTGDVGSSGDPAVIVSRSVLDRVEEITFELSEVSPHDPPPGFYLEGFSAEVDLGVTLGEGETVICVSSVFRGRYLPLQ